MAAREYTMRIELRSWAEPLLCVAGKCALIAARCGVPLGLAVRAYACVGGFVVRHGLMVKR